MNDVERAVDIFVNGYSCSQAVCGIFAQRFGLDQDMALKISGGFGGGMGRLGCVCGALTGSFMVLGLRYASAEAGTGEAKLHTYEMVREAARRFEARNGSMMCHDLLGYNLDDPAEYLAASDAGVFRTICPKLVRSAAEILEELL